jgi:hypothetical protein
MKKKYVYLFTEGNGSMSFSCRDKRSQRLLLKRESHSHLLLGGLAAKGANTVSLCYGCSRIFTVVITQHL